MFNKKESNKSTSREKFSDDRDFVKEFISEGLHLPQQDIQSFVRLGRYDASKRPRPLKIVFQNKSSQFNVMNNLSILKEAEDKYKSIAISYDRTIQERELFRKKVQEAKVLQEKNADKRYVVNGAYNPYIKELTRYCIIEQT